MRAVFVNEGFGLKDKIRMEDIQTKSAGDHNKEISLASTQAKIIKNAAKAKARAEAAEEVFGVGSEIAEIFNDRAEELGGSFVKSQPSKGNISPIGIDGVRPQAPIKPHNPISDYVLPSDDPGFMRGTKFSMAKKLGIGSFAADPSKELGREPKMLSQSSIFSVGKVSLKTGWSSELQSTLLDFWGEDTTAEVWQNQEHAKQNNYKLVCGSGNKAMGIIGDTSVMYADQSGRYLGMHKLVDYVPLEHLSALSKKYPSMTAFTYK